MIEAEVNPRDLMEFHLAVDGLDPDKLLQGEWLPFLRGIHYDIKPYPPMLPKQKYKRTGHLGNSWEYEVLNPRAAEIGNVARYAGYVQGVEQAAIHTGRWKRLVDVGERALEEFLERLAKKVDRIWTR